MIRKDILELRRRLKKDHCTFTQMCGCYVSAEKQMILKFRESFLNLDEDEFHKYLEIAKKVLSGTIGNNILKLNFPLNEDFTNKRQTSLMQLKKSQLKDDNLLDAFYELIIENYDYTGNFLILIFHDAYDVTVKTTDNTKLDESEEVYEYVLCALCPVSLSDPGLSYSEEENQIKARIRDWVVNVPTHGFVFPAFVERSSDVNSIMYYTKNTKDPHPELMENVLGCDSKQTATIQKETFQSIIKESFQSDEEKADQVFMEIQENLSTMITEYNSIYDDTDCEPITLTKDHVQNLLIESGVPEEITTQIENSYIENFGDDIPLAESLIDKKTLKANEQRKREENLLKQVEILETRLEEVTQEVATTNEVHPEYDVVLQVKPEKIPQIKSQIIDGQKYIVIPINENEQTTVNGLDDLI